jgi:outer membrane protein insertion porin family
MRVFGTLLLLTAFFYANTAFAQTEPVVPAKTDTVPVTSVDPELLNILNSKVPKKYVIQEIKVTGAKLFDPAIVISVSGLAVGDEVTLPGGDLFSKAINRLWTQNMFTNINVFITKVEGRNIWIEIVAQERPMLSDFKFKGVKKNEGDELRDKVGVFQNRVVTDNMRLSAIDNIRKYYIEKGFMSVDVKIDETPDVKNANKTFFTFVVNKGKKVKIDNIHFFGNEEVPELALKRQLKGTKEMSKVTFYPPPVISPYGEVKTQSFQQFMKDKGYLHPSMIRDYLEPWFRFKMFANAKFNEKKYIEDKEKVISYLNSLGYRDAQIIADTQYLNSRGNLNVDLKIDEGGKYYFGNINWKGNTKYGDSVLSMLLSIKKGDTYNINTLNKRLGKELSQEGGDISSLYMDICSSRLNPWKQRCTMTPLILRSGCVKVRRPLLRISTLLVTIKRKSTLSAGNCARYLAKNSQGQT